MNEIKLEFKASNNYNKYVALEPWGLGYDIPKNKQLDIVLYSKDELDYEIEEEDNQNIIVFIFSSFTYKVYLDSELIDEDDEGYDGYEKDESTKKAIKILFYGN